MRQFFGTLRRGGLAASAVGIAVGSDIISASQPLVRGSRVGPWDGHIVVGQDQLTLHTARILVHHTRVMTGMVEKLLTSRGPTGVQFHENPEPRLVPGLFIRDPRS